MSWPARGAVALLAMLMLAACGSTTPPTGPSPSAPVQAPTSITDSTAGPTASASPGTSTAPGGPSPAPSPTPGPSDPGSGPEVVVPAGVQYLEPATATVFGLPASSTWDRFSTPDGETSPTLAIGRDAKGNAVVAARTGTSWTRAVLATPKSVKAPRPYNVTNWVRADAAAVGAHGYLVVGEANVSDAYHLSISGLGFAWFSADGRTWRRTDFRQVLGTGANFQPRGLVASGDGWLVAGSLTNRSASAKSQVVVLSTKDGRTWKQVAHLKGTWGLAAQGLEMLGDRVVLEGLEWVCSDSGHHLIVGIGNPQLRLWSSGDGGATWTAGDWTAGGVNAAAAPMPTTSSQCRSVQIGQLSTSGSYLGVVNGRAVVLAGDHTRAAVSSDLATWTIADVPGGKPTGNEYVYTVGGTAVAAVPDGTGTLILSLEARRNAGDGVGGFGNAVLAWRTDDGTSWNRLATARPVETGSASAFVAAPDGSVYLGTTDDTGATARYRHSVAGVLASTTACTAAAHADCAFSTLTGSFAGADLSGINLYGATIAAGADLGGANLSGARLTGLLAEAGVNLTKANLTGADLTRATLAEGVVLAGANLTRADLSFAHISVATADSTGITLAGSNLRNASLPAVDFAGMSLKGTTIAGTSVGPTFLRANFAGARLSDVSVGVDADGTAGSMSGYAFGNRNLAGWFFGGTALHGPGSLRGADFTHAKVDGLSFYNVDLTGARFPKGTRSKTDYGSGRGVLFSGEVVCPDGKAPKAVGTLYDCRLGG